MARPCVWQGRVYAGVVVPGPEGALGRGVDRAPQQGPHVCVGPGPRVLEYLLQSVEASLLAGIGSARCSGTQQKP